MKVKFAYNIMENKDTGYCVFKYRDVETQKTHTFVGHNLPTNQLTYEFTVKEINNPKYGKQYEVLSYEEVIGTNRDDIVEYISVSYKGIGKKIAGRIYDKYGDQSIDIIENEPERLSSISGITHAKIQAIKETCSEKIKNKELYMLLMEHDFSIKLIEKICSIYKETTLERIKNDPYILCGIRGINFYKADTLREKCNISLTDERRIYAACIQTLKDNMLLGNVGMKKNEMLVKLHQMLKINIPLKDCDSFLWKHVVHYIQLEKLAYRKVLHNGEIVQYIYMKYMEQAERSLAQYIIRILQQPDKKVNNIDELIKKASMQNNIIYDISQRNAVKEVFNNQLIIITGGPGTGKTTTTNLICTLHQMAFPDEDIVLLAPTGRAARKMAESTGLPANTIHSGMGLAIHDEISEYDDEVEPITDSLIIVDEFSMVDLLLASKLFNNVRNSRIVLVGDADQLPSVGPGNVLLDLIESGVVPVVKLAYEHRQDDSASLINENAHTMKMGIESLREGDDFTCEYYDDRNMTKEDMVIEMENQIIKEYLNFYNDPEIASIFCLVPYKRHHTGVYEINKKIQNIINPANGIEMKGHNGMVFRVGDPVMHLVNAEIGVYNGDLGTVTYISVDKTTHKYQMVASYETANGTTDVVYTPDTMDSVTLAYAVTIHKSQGSECDAVISCLTEFNPGYPDLKSKMLYRNILYTCITRAKKKVRLHTTHCAIKSAINNVNTVNRCTLLAYNIQKLYEENMRQQQIKFG